MLMIFVFYFFAAILVFLSYKSLLRGLAYLRYFRRELKKPPSVFKPFATVIAPCRDLDEGLADNLRSLLAQDYPGYEVIFVVDNLTDPAVSIINNVRDGSAVPSRLVTARTAIDSSQKVENLREAVLHCSADSRVFVFADSDVRPAANWLKNLVEPLAHDSVGAATGYRWFIAKNPSFGSELRSAWNASIATALGPGIGSNFCWGGSTAIRRDVFERLDIREKWLGTLSDDFTVTRAVKAAGLAIVFVPRALTASVADCSFFEMLEFTTRQMKITRVYSPHLWLISFLGSGVFVGVLVTAFLIVVLNPVNGFPVVAAVLTIGLVTTFSVGKSWLRLTAVKLALPEYRAELDRQFWTQNTLWLLTPVVFFYNCLAALVSRRITWRGIKYELKSPTETVIIAD